MVNFLRQRRRNELVGDSKNQPKSDEPRFTKFETELLEALRSARSEISVARLNMNYLNDTYSDYKIRASLNVLLIKAPDLVRKRTQPNRIKGVDITLELWRYIG